MVALTQYESGRPGASGCSTGCGTSCGAGLEKVYPATAVRWGAMSWIGEFRFNPGTVFKCGAKVVIQTDRGIELGQQVSLSCTGCNKHVSREQIKRYVETSGAEFFKLNSGRILREATDQDVDEHERLNARNREDIDRGQLLAAQLQLSMKIVTVEHLLGGERIVFYFRSEDRIDFRDLVRELAHHYQTRIEMRQVRPREEARLVADYEICGRECCCKNFLKQMRPVSMRMAKLQKSTLDPAKLSGRCGRLRCCLRYEHVGYEELDRKLPRLGTRISSPNGQGVVIDRQILTQLLLVRGDDEREFAVPIEDVTLAEAQTRPVVQPADQADSDAARDSASAERPQGPRRRRRRGGRGGEPAEAARPHEGSESPPASEHAAEDASRAPNETPLGEAPGPAGEQAGGRRRRRRRRRGPGAPPADGAPDAGPPPE
jgi:cell fate regulator YaaT (PSP1 superfamily)